VCREPPVQTSREGRVRCLSQLHPDGTVGRVDVNGDATPPALTHINKQNKPTERIKKASNYKFSEPFIRLQLQPKATPTRSITNIPVNPHRKKACKHTRTASSAVPSNPTIRCQSPGSALACWTARACKLRQRSPATPDATDRGDGAPLIGPQRRLHEKQPRRFGLLLVGP